MSGATSASTAAGFKWGTADTPLNSTKTVTAGSASFSAALNGLSPATTYYYMTVVQIGTKDFECSVRSFKTAEQISYSVRDWLELPAITGNEDYVGTFKSGSKRNYTYNYNYDNYAALRVAYPLYSSVTSRWPESTGHSLRSG